LIWTASCPCRLLAPSSFSDKHQQPPVSVPNVHSVFGAPAINSSAARAQLPAAVPTNAGLSAYQRAHRRSSDDNLTITSELKRAIDQQASWKSRNAPVPNLSETSFSTAIRLSHVSTAPLVRSLISKLAPPRHHSHGTRRFGGDKEQTGQQPGTHPCAANFDRQFLWIISTQPPEPTPSWTAASDPVSSFLPNPSSPDRSHRLRTTTVVISSTPRLPMIRQSAISSPKKHTLGSLYHSLLPGT
jgi:hypothetical protein